MLIDRVSLLAAAVKMGSISSKNLDCLQMQARCSLQKISGCSRKTIAKL